MGGNLYRSANFNRKHQWIATISKHLQGSVYTSRQGLTKGLKRKGGLGFLPEFLGHESEETRFLREFDFTGKVCFDVGGFEGHMSLFFAKTARQVVTFEANPAHVVRILENARLNHFDNVLVFNVAVGSKDGLLTLYYDPLMPAAATGDPEISQEVRSGGGPVEKFCVVLTSIDSHIERFGLPVPDFVKIDIEGMEIEALRGMEQLIERHEPELYLELHGSGAEDKCANATAVIHFLTSHGYEVFDVERKRVITRDTPSGIESPWHIYGKRPSRPGSRPSCWEN